LGGFVLVEDAVEGTGLQSLDGVLVVGEEVVEVFFGDEVGPVTPQGRGGSE
jgi:hypothetical protein